MIFFRYLVLLTPLSFVFIVNANGAGCSTLPTTPAQWGTHACGTGGTNCAPSTVPPPAPVGSASPLPMAASFAELLNPMVACCGIGWGENTNEGIKLDCVEAVPPTAPNYDTFLNFYNYGATADPIKTAGLTYPNRAFALGNDGIPLNGFYNQSGKRCPYINPTTRTAQAQMALFDTAIAQGKPPPDVDPYCCNLVILAVERLCPVSDLIPVPGPSIQVAKNATATTRRCTAAKEMKLDFGIFDLCDPTLVKRGRFRMATSYLGVDPKTSTVVLTDSVSVSNLVSQFYPPPASPSPNPSPCPASPAFFVYPWSNGKCGLMKPEPLPTP